MRANEPSVLPIARAVLRALVLMNWLCGAFVLALLVATVIAGPWTVAALGFGPQPAGGSLIAGVRGIATLGLLAVPLNDAVLRRLAAMVETVRMQDPFAASNPARLQSIAWSLLALQVISIAVGALAKAISTPGHPLHLDAGFSISGWLAVLLTFVLARVFTEASRMREDLQGTV